MAQTQIGNKEKSSIIAIRKAVEDSFGEQITGPKSIEKLRFFLFRRTGQFLGTTTLKRIWNYISGGDNHRYTTLSVLARAIGYEDFLDFCRSRESSGGMEREISSTPKFNKFIDVNRDLKTDDELKIFWYPGRECRVRYLGGMQFEVMEAKNTRLRVGDKFFCHLILPNHPLYLSSLTRGDSQPMAYICGKIHGGIQIELLNCEDSSKLI